MKDIKFRAYIKKLNWVVNVERINFDCKTVEVDLSEGNGDTSEYDFNEVELMQYTGLKDDNDVAIFEGDIIKQDGWPDIFYLTIFKDCKYIAKKIGHHDGDIFTQRDIDLDAVLWPVIIGNKYDNPELLDECIKRGHRAKMNIYEDACCYNFKEGDK